MQTPPTSSVSPPPSTPKIKPKTVHMQTWGLNLSEQQKALAKILEIESNAFGDKLVPYYNPIDKGNLSGYLIMNQTMINDLQIIAEKEEGFIANWKNSLRTGDRCLDLALLRVDSSGELSNCIPCSVDYRTLLEPAALKENKFNQVISAMESIDITKQYLSLQAEALRETEQKSEAVLFEANEPKYDKTRLELNKDYKSILINLRNEFQGTQSQSRIYINRPNNNYLSEEQLEYIKNGDDTSDPSVSNLFHFAKEFNRLASDRDAIFASNTIILAHDLLTVVVPGIIEDPEARLLEIKNSSLFDNPNAEIKRDNLPGFMLGVNPKTEKQWARIVQDKQLLSSLLHEIGGQTIAWASDSTINKTDNVGRMFNSFTNEILGYDHYDINDGKPEILNYDEAILADEARSLEAKIRKTHKHKLSPLENVAHGVRTTAKLSLLALTMTGAVGFTQGAHDMINNNEPSWFPDIKTESITSKIDLGISELTQVFGGEVESDIEKELKNRARESLTNEGIDVITIPIPTKGVLKEMYDSGDAVEKTSKATLQSSINYAFNRTDIILSNFLNNGAYKEIQTKSGARLGYATTATLKGEKIGVLINENTNNKTILTVVSFSGKTALIIRVEEGNLSGGIDKLEANEKKELVPLFSGLNSQD